MYCKRCGKEIADNSSYCRYCGEKQDVEEGTNKSIENIEHEGSSDVAILTDKSSNRHKPNRKIVIAIVLVVILVAVIVGGVIINRNSFDTSITKDSFTYEYSIKDDRIEVEITAVVDIKNFKFQIFCYRTENILHQYSKRFEEDSINKGTTKKYTIMMSEVIASAPYLETWKLDSVRISDYSGKIRNKDK